jgi:hypothetical protein
MLLWKSLRESTFWKSSLESTDVVSVSGMKIPNTDIFIKEHQRLARKAKIVRRVGRRDRIIISVCHLERVHTIERIIALYMNVVLYLLQASVVHDEMEILSLITDIMQLFAEALSGSEKSSQQLTTLLKLKVKVRSFYIRMYDQQCQRQDFIIFGFSPRFNTGTCLAWIVQNIRQDGKVVTEMDLSSAFENAHLNPDDLLHYVGKIKLSERLSLQVMHDIEILIQFQRKLPRRILFPEGVSEASLLKQFPRFMRLFTFDDDGTTKGTTKIKIPLSSLIQGSPLSPSFFNLFLWLAYLKWMPKVSGPAIAVYGDNLYCTSAERLKDFLNHLGMKFTVEGSLGIGSLCKTLGFTMLADKEIITIYYPYDKKGYGRKYAKVAKKEIVLLNLGSVNIVSNTKLAAGLIKSSPGK